ncbi:hypothetical protein Tco_1217370 [Tanacetum coccineum]
MRCPQHYLTKMQEAILFYNGLDVPTRQILYPKGAIPTKTTADAKVAIQKMSKYSQKWHNGTSRTRSTETFDGLAAIQAQLNNLGKEIKKVNEKVYAAQVGSSTDVAIRNQGASIKTLEIQIEKISKNSRLIFDSRQTTIPFPCRLNDYYYDEKKGSYGLQRLNAHSYGATRVDDSLSRKEKVPRSFTLPCYINNVCFKNALVDLAASVSVMPLSSYLNLGLGELAHTKLTVELADRIVKHLKGIAENVLVGIVVENMDGYRDQDMGDIIFGETFCKASCVEAKRFDGLITIHNGPSIRRPRWKKYDKVGEVSIIWNSCS